MSFEVSEQKRLRIIKLTLLGCIIVLNILDYAKWLPGDADFLKKILSWVLIAYVFYRASPTKQFFGERNRQLDIILIISYFILILGNISGFAAIAIEEAGILTPIYKFLAGNNAILSHTSLFVGGVMLILLSVYMTFRLHVTEPSLMNVIHQKGIPKSIYEKIKRFGITFLVLVGFFRIIFKLAAEWLAHAVDALLVVVALSVYVWILFKYHHKEPHSNPLIYQVVYKVGSVGEDFYEKFIELLHSKRRIFMAISGMLVLHLLVDVGNYIIPYVTNSFSWFYFGHFVKDHIALYSFLLKDISLATPLLSKISVVWIYAFNLLAVLLLLSLPAYIWYRLFRRSGFKVSNLKLSLFFISVMVFIFSPVFKIESLISKKIGGVDILTKSVFENNLVFNPALILFLSLGIGIIIFLISYNHWIKEKLIALAIILVDLFFAVYIFLYFNSLRIYYFWRIPTLFGSSHYFSACFMSLLAVIHFLFFITGFIFFLMETKKEFRYIR